ncbi:TonB-dependent receptor [Bacteroidota bacterium]
MLAKVLFYLLLTIFLSYTNSHPQVHTEDPDSVIYKTETIEVDALRGIDRLTPITFQDIKRETIERKYWMEDLPMFLKGNTSINSYSESGSSVGYSYFSLRGFDQRRISILVNGTPQNDPEDHQVYWVDLSDIMSSVENIQIQRGIGTALYGSSAIGGVINLQTIDFFKRKFLNAIAGYGDYNSKRYSLEYSSGLVKGGFGFYGKFTKTETDGYRNLSWSDHWSYFLSAGKIIGDNSVLKLNFYGGPIKNHLAYLGVTKDYLDGKITGDKRVDRKYNPLEFPNETDNYNQPHYELIFNFQLEKNLFVSNTVNYIRGDGYFVTNFPTFYGLDFDYFRLQPYFTSDTTTFNTNYYRRNPDGSFYYVPGQGYQVVRCDIVTDLYVNNDTYGWFPKIQLTHSKDKGTLVIGGEVKFHKSEHYGEITFGDALPQGTQDNYRYYFYNGKKRTFSVYANEVIKITNKLTAMAGAQYVYHKYILENDKFKPYEFDVDYSFFTPRVGMNYNFNDNFKAFVNFSIAKREPRLKDIYDAENQFSVPNFQTVDTVNNIYENPLIKPEEMFNYELGFGYTSEILKSNLNFYFMDFKNEIVSNGQLDLVGQPINGNAGKSIHRGLELEFEFTPFKEKFGRTMVGPLTLSGNLNLSENYFTEYREVLGTDSLGKIIYGNDYSDNTILLNPGIIGNISLSYYNDLGTGIYFSMQHVGKQYLDNSENDRKNPNAHNQSRYVDKVIDAYTVFNAGLTLNFASLFSYSGIDKLFKKIETSLRINNIFDKLYETYGTVDYYGIPYWIPAADRSFYLDLRIGF